MSKTYSRGAAVVWVLVVLGALTAAVGSIEFSVDSRPHEPGMFWAFWLGLAVALAGLTFEGRRDFHGVATFLVVAGLITALITGAVATLGERPHPYAGATSALAALVAVGSAAYLAWAQFRRAPVPNLLCERFGRGAISELDGVQFAALQSASQLHAGEGFEITLLVQNCWDQPRDFTLRLEQETGSAIERLGVKFEKVVEVTLGPAEVIELAVPVVAGPDANGRFSLLARPEVSGRGGRRLRTWRAQAYQRPIPPWLTAAGALIGVIAWGGGLRFCASVSPSGALHTAEASLPPVRVARLFSLDAVGGAPGGAPAAGEPS